MGLEEHSEAFQAAIEAGDADKAMSFLDNDFQFSGPVPEPINGHQWMGLMKSMRTAFPDIQYRFKTVGVEGNVVTSTNQLSGTHTGELDLTFMGMGIIPPTGKSFTQPEQTSMAVWDGDTLQSVHIEADASEGLMSILGQLGIEPPAN